MIRYVAALVLALASFPASSALIVVCNDYSDVDMWEAVASDSKAVQDGFTSLEGPYALRTVEGYFHLPALSCLYHNPPVIYDLEQKSYLQELSVIARSKNGMYGWGSSSGWEARVLTARVDVCNWGAFIQNTRWDNPYDSSPSLLWGTSPCTGGGQGGIYAYSYVGGHNYFVAMSESSLIDFPRRTEIIYLNGMSGEEARYIRQLGELQKGFDAHAKKIGFPDVVTYSGQFISPVISGPYEVFMQARCQDTGVCTDGDPAQMALAHYLAKGAWGPSTISAIGQYLASPSRWFKPEKVNGVIAKIRHALDNAKRVVVVGHSQGSLYANRAIQQLSSTDRRSVGAVHVGALTDRVDGGAGRYVTMTNDRLVHALNLQTNNVLPPNTTNSEASDAASGDHPHHGFLETYLAGDVSGPAIMSAISQTARSLQYPAVNGPRSTSDLFDLAVTPPLECDPGTIPEWSGNPAHPILIRMVSTDRGPVPCPVPGVVGDPVTTALAALCKLNNQACSPGHAERLVELLRAVCADQDPGCESLPQDPVGVLLALGCSNHAYLCDPTPEGIETWVATLCAAYPIACGGIPPNVPGDPIALLLALGCSLDGRLCNPSPPGPEGILQAVCGAYPAACGGVPPNVLETVIGALCAANPVACDPSAENALLMAQQTLCNASAMLCDPQLPSDPVAAAQQLACSIDPNLCEGLVEDPIGAAVDVACGLVPMLCQPMVPPDPAVEVQKLITTICGIDQLICSPPLDNPYETVMTIFCRKYGSVVCDSVTPLPVDQMLRDVRNLELCNRYYIAGRQISAESLCETLPDPDLGS